ncbi:MAG: type II toxin-antitoxin system death-on-curing family toxin [Candidatus Electryonea clarkiae]|nr:type II toxin-antitoxin system death-on-curing family toxin [Candidatus Electryonea clarkiae]MDP8286419.1 type II toxin-antitoxin system death-on-curing family toxin [Candidatus Electryonea clarkiae]
MSDIQFLTLDEVLQIHQDQITRYGGMTGMRDFGLLQSAVAMPMAQFDGVYLHPDLYAMAAAYLFHITRNHPFLDGNKRAGVVSAIVFLKLNGIEVAAEESSLEELVFAVAHGDIGKENISEFFSDTSHNIFNNK